MYAYYNIHTKIRFRAIMVVTSNAVNFRRMTAFSDDEHMFRRTPLSPLSTAHPTNKPHYRLDTDKSHHQLAPFVPR